MSRTAYTNDTTTGHYIGNVFVPAGGTRTVDARLLAPTPAADEAPPANPLQILADGPVKGIVEALPALDAAGCDALLELERAGKKRGSAIEAIELRKLELVDEAAEAEKAAVEAAAAAAAAGEGGDGE